MNKHEIHFKRDVTCMR